MRVLVACECSGVVRRAFRARGHDAWSCDLCFAEDMGEHIRGDVLDVLGDGWDLMIAHPPCTYLASSGLHWNKRRRGRDAETEKALAFVKTLLDAPIERIAVENPIGCISTRIRPPDQTIQPWMFGENASKATCLWLKGLDPLKHGEVVPPNRWRLVKCAADLPVCECCGEEAWCPEHEMHFADCECVGPTQDDAKYKTINGYLFGSKSAPHPVWANQTPSGQNKVGGPNQSRIRAATYSGIAAAMAEQWG